jgi:hypothetical protein
MNAPRQIELFADRDWHPACGLLVRLDRSIDRVEPCCKNIAIIGPGRGSHAASLTCTGCNRHRGWLPRRALPFVIQLTRRFGAPIEPIVWRGAD